MPNFDDLKLSVEALSGGKNTVLLDDLGMPSIMVKIPKFKISDVITGGADTTHPAFIVNGVEKEAIYISKYQNIVMNSRAYSLPHKDPAVYTNFDQAKTYCEAKGAGWHLMTNAEWAAIALWCKKNGFMPRGNNYAGADNGAFHEAGVRTYDWILNYNWNNRAYKIDGSNYYHTGRVATGSGPAAWAHNNSNDGIFDLNGNVWEWNGGLRLKNGEIQIIPNNDAAQAINQGDTSTLWKAIMPDGSLVDPGTAGTLKFDYTGAPAAGTANFHLTNTLVNQQVDDTPYGTKSFETITANAGVNVPAVLKTLGILPVDASHGGDGFWFRNNGERLPLRGGSFNSGASAGVFALYLYNERTLSTFTVGFRAAFVNL